MLYWDKSSWDIRQQVGNLYALQPGQGQFLTCRVALGCQIKTQEPGMVKHTLCGFIQRETLIGSGKKFELNQEFFPLMEQKSAKPALFVALLICKIKK